MRFLRHKKKVTKREGPSSVPHHIISWFFVHFTDCKWWIYIYIWIYMYINLTYISYWDGCLYHKAPHFWNTSGAFLKPSFEPETAGASGSFSLKRWPAGSPSSRHWQATGIGPAARSWGGDMQSRNDHLRGPGINGGGLRRRTCCWSSNKNNYLVGDKALQHICRFMLITHLCHTFHSLNWTNRSEKHGKSVGGGAIALWMGSS